MTSVVKTVLTLGTILVFMQADTWLEREDTRHKAGEFYLLTLSTLLGMFYMVSAGSFLLFYVGLELASIPMACLIAFDKYRHHSAEAGAKFILNAMFSSGLMLYGLSLVYGTCGTMYFNDISTMITGSPLQILAMVLFFAGLGFKLSLVPSTCGHPIPIRSSDNSQCLSFCYLKRSCSFCFDEYSAESIRPDGCRLESVTLCCNRTDYYNSQYFAILQKDLKRFMAYSSISQAGYIMLAVLGASAQGMASLVYYVVVYIVANLAVFGVIGTVEQHNGGTVDRDAYNGFYKTNPKLSFVMTIALFSLAGIPPFAGFSQNSSSLHLLSMQATGW